MTLDFSRCRNVWVPDDSEAGGFWSPPPSHVKIGVAEIIEHPYFLLADDMGGMKSAQAMIAAQFLHDADVIDRVIIIAPASVRPLVWFDKDLGQIYQHAFADKHLKVSEYHKKIRQWETGPADAPPLKIIVTNYEWIRGEHLLTLLPYCGPKTLLILDETNAVRSYDAEQTKACMSLRWKTNKKGYPMMGVPRCGRILELNGTPVADSPMDLFSQANLLHPSILGCKYITHYKARYALQVPVLGGNLMSPYPKKEKQPDGSTKLVPQQVMKMAGWTNLEDLQARLAPYVLRREAKDLGINFALPPVALEVRLTKQTWRAYCQMRDEMVIWLQSGVATAATAAVKSIRLSQITSGFVGGVEDPGIGETLLDFADETPITCGGQGIEFIPVNTIQEIGREKLDFAIEWHKELLRRYPDLKLLTWCRFVPELRRYLHEVKKMFDHPVGAACGQSIFDGNKQREREEALRLLHPQTAPKGPVTVGATQGTGALGLNFTACRTVLDLSYDFSPWKKKQGDARVNRPGQTGMVSFFYLIAVGPAGQKTIDHHVMMQRLGKTNINEWTMAGWVQKLMEE